MKRETVFSLRRKLKLVEHELKERGIIAVILFGSSLKGKTHPFSDVDIAVFFKDEPSKRDTEWVYLELQKDLRRVVWNYAERWLTVGG